MRRLVIFVTLALVISACGDDDATPTTSAPTTAAPGTTNQSSPTTAAVGTTVAPATTAPSGGATTAGATADIEALLQLFEQTAVKLTYEVGEPGDTSTLIMSQDPAAGLEVIEIVDDGARIITSDDGIVICAPAQGGCFETPAGTGGLGLGQGLLGPSVGGYLALAGGLDSPVFDVETDTITIAGRSGICYTFSPTALAQGDAEFVRQCIDAELGFTLLIESQETGGQVERAMTLLAYAEPTPEDFEPTGPVVQMPTG